MDTEKVATVVPAGELSGRGVVVEIKVMPVGVGTDALLHADRAYRPRSRRRHSRSDR
jgi:hypothetical protein